MTLTAELRLRRGDFELDVTIDCPDATVLAVLGPNGAGKSTVLSLLAGLIRPTGGSIVLNGRTLADGSRWVPPHQRAIALLGQRPLLFPHLSVLDNVAFGPWARSRRRRTARESARRWLAETDVETLAERRPSGLSGGQAQRVALARALAVEPEILLLDEPMAALDVDQRPAMRELLGRVVDQRRSAGRSTVVVTHDPLDLTALADRAIVLADGRVVESAPVDEIVSRPRTPFTARLIRSADPGCGCGRDRSAADGASTGVGPPGDQVDGVMRDPQGR